ncbi:hypothetical protein SUGI_0919620 [Cryptomeria japonica]|nr:hypothetical protein SUGI_0919620 [Cryptomeria japonica]
MAAASLRRSDISFRRQGSSGIVWGRGSNPGEIDSKPIISSMEKQVPCSNPEPITLFHSRSTGSIQTPMSMFHTQRSGDATMPQPSHKSKFRFGRWIKRVLLKSR